jgi:hypothetical protein
VIAGSIHVGGAMDHAGCVTYRVLVHVTVPFLLCPCLPL